MITGGKLRFSLRKVERAAVGLGSTGDKVNNKCYNSGDMSFENKPKVLLLGYDAFDRHSAGKANHSDDRQADREFVAHHLGTRAERTDESELVVRRPTCKQDAEHAYRRYGNQEEDADIEADDLNTVTPWEAGKRKHRGDNYEVGSQREEEAVDMVEVDNLFDEHLEHIGERLEETPWAYAVRAETALECGAELTLVIYIEKSEQGVYQQQAHADEQTFDGDGEPSGHE